jgi:RNA polymerase sigma-70 factor (ECF subfamily)
MATPLAALEPGVLPVHRGAVEVRQASLAELVLAVQRGQRPAFAELYARFHRVVHAIALARVAPRDADDVVQDVFAQAWRKLAQLRDPAAFPGWLLAIARSRATDCARRTLPLGRDGDAATTSLGAARAAAASHAAVQPPRAEAAAALAAIRALPETYRETLIMRLVEQLSGPEIAERTGMTPESVRVHLHRGMKLLRERLGGAGGSP